MAADVSGLRADAQAARDELWSWALTTSPSSDRMRALAEAADALLDQADRLAAAGDVEEARSRYARVGRLADDGLAETLRKALIRRQPLRVRRLRFGA
jgi:hypothetical protein